MPRLSWPLLAKARKEDKLLPLLLRTCRDLCSARRELRWLEDHARNVARNRNRRLEWKSILKQSCHERAQGRPLQYILGTEYFGELEIACTPGVLIPRQETATSVSYLLTLLHRGSASLPKKLNVLDLCTGTGCIPLLFASSLASLHKSGKDIGLLGVDISPRAINLARINHQKQLAQASGPHQRHVKLALNSLEFVRADIFNSSSAKHNSKTSELITLLRRRRQTQWDVLISNPPYISPHDFHHVTTRSVRNYEPKLALIPERDDNNLSDDERGDLFYPRLLKIAEEVDVKVLLMEVGDLKQAQRVAAMAKEKAVWDDVEIWRDEPELGETAFEDCVPDVPVIGTGNGRSVCCWRGSGRSWLGR